MKLYGLQCFGVNENFGNKAFVIEQDKLNIEERLVFTKKQDVATCVFMDTIDDGSISLDYYYPHAPSPLCLHGTLAAGYVYFKKNTNKKSVIIVKKHQQHIKIEKKDSAIFLAVNQQECPQLPMSPLLIQRLLNLNNAEAVLGSNIVSVGSPKLLIEVDSKIVLNSLLPDLHMIYKWGSEHNVMGCYVYFKEDDVNIYGRNFNHLDSQFEDSATGVAAGALSCHFKRDLRIHQGYNLGNPCVINTRYVDGTVFIGGNVFEFNFN